MFFGNRISFSVSRNLSGAVASSVRFRSNIIASYASQIYCTLAAIVILPFYIRYMGAEAYGLVGFFGMLQVWFNLLDIGLTPTISRETARFNGKATDALTYRRLVRSLEGVFVAVALLGGGGLFLSAGYISTNWLQSSQLSTGEIKTAVQLMAAIVAMRWMGGLYRGAISGFERLIWLGGYNAIIATVRFVGVLWVLKYIGATPTIFFAYQFMVAILELAILMTYSHHLLPRVSHRQNLPWSWRPLKPVLKFSLTIAFVSVTWVLVTQTDKLVLSKLLPLADYGYFTLAVLVAGGVSVISGPVSLALMPRMARLEAEGDHAGLIRVYRQATQMVAVIAGAACATLAFCAEPLLWAWTGDAVLARQAAPVLILYALGNGILGVAAFPYYLQYAKGELRMHLIGSTVFVVLLIPSIIWAAGKYGGIGAGYVWLSMNILSFVAWLPFVHHKFVRGLNVRWYFQDVLIIFSAIALAGFGLNEIFPHAASRGWQMGMMMVFGFLLLLVGASASTFAWEKAIKKFSLARWGFK